MDASPITAAEIRERVQAEGLLGRGAVVAMLSGGQDSVCLLDVAVALCGARRVHALHVNYGLRAAADGDERHCRQLCERLGVSIEVVHVNRAQRASGNLHAWARELRYGKACELADQLEGAGREQRAYTRIAAVVATGHTASDQVETILYRLAASPGRRALLGMPLREGRLVRPLLGLAREATAAYCRERQLAWREDLSNDNERYARARVRHGLMPALDAIHPAARANVLRTAQLLREETELLDALVDAELLDRTKIALAHLRALPPALQRLIVIRLAENATGTFVPQAGERVGELLELGNRGGKAELHIGGLAGAIIDNGELHMKRIEPRQQRAARHQ